MKTILLSLFLSLSLFGQTTDLPSNIRIKDIPGAVNNNFAASVKFSQGTVIPSTCDYTKGIAFFKTDTKKWYDCTDVNVYTLRVNPDLNGNIQSQSVILGPKTIGAGANHLLAASACPRCLTIVTDAASASDCTVGSGSIFAVCYSNGTTWGPLGSTGGGGGGTPPAYTPVTFNATPAFSVTTGAPLQGFSITLTGNVTSSTLSGSLTVGQEIWFEICQDSSGGHTFAWPINVTNPGSIDTAINACTIQLFRYDGTSAMSVSPAQSDSTSAPALITADGIYTLPTTSTTKRLVASDDPLFSGIGGGTGYVSPPTVPSSSGSLGNWSVDASYFYAFANSRWNRVAWDGSWTVTQVPDITASPVPGSYSNAQTLTLAGGISADYKCFTVDGTAPTGTTSGCTNGTHYTTSFTSPSSTFTLKAISNKAAYTESNLFSGLYTISAGGITLLDHKIGASAGGTAEAAVTGLNCTGASLIYAVVSNVTSYSGIALSDSSGNTYTSCISSSCAAFSSSAATKIFYVVNPTVTSSMKVTTDATGSYAGIAAGCFSGISLTSPLDQYTSGESSLTIALGPVTPTQDGELLLVGWGTAQTTGTATVDNSFIPIDFANTDGGHSLGVGVSYKIQSTAAAITPTLTTTGATTDQGAALVTFKHQ